MKNKLVILLLLLLVGCGKSYVPKPEGYLRVDYPAKEYQLFADEAPYEFEYPLYAKVVHHESSRTEPFWYDVLFPVFDGTVYLSYKKLDGNLEAYIQDTRSLVYKHTSQSDGIEEIPFVDTLHKRYGILYDLEGNVASPVQFFLTDSTDHFIRGSLYFNTTPNRDSLNPIINFVRSDIEHLMETVQWK